MKIAILTGCICVIVILGVHAKPNPSEHEVFNLQPQLLEELDGLGILKRTKRGSKLPPSCTSEYKTLKHHTMCDYKDSRTASQIAVSSADKNTILAEHNKYRSAVNPTATNMLKMYYDDNMAKIAAKWARVCKNGHDKYREVPDYNMAIGQNIFLANYKPTWTEVISSWQTEIKYFKYGKRNSLSKVGHYTQVVNKMAVAVGCGAALCKKKYVVVCNYAFGQSDIRRPYDSGASCSACPNMCRDKLCDCGGKFCLNGGTLNLSTCQCACPAHATGSRCEQTVGCVADPSHCGQKQPYGYPKSYCKKYSNVPIECPVMCGVIKC